MAPQAPSPLTANNIHTTSVKVDKDAFITSFLRSQKSFTSTYKSEGLLYSASWSKGDSDTHEQDPQGSTKKAQRRPPSDLASTVLVPRVPLADSPNLTPGPQAPARRASRNQADCTDDEDERPTKSLPKVPRKTGNIATVKKAAGEPQQQSEPKGATGKKRARSHDSDYAARLEQRRDRRRAKRAIVKPILSDESDAESEQTRTRREPKKKSQNKGQKLATGLALMHGFNATNVGSGRITVKPSRGLYSKGKASGMTMTAAQKKKKASKGQRWTEASFLNRRVKGDQKSEGSGAKSDTSSEAGAAKSKRHKFKLCNYDHKREAQRQSSPDPDEVSEKKSSVVWDIEHDSDVPTANSVDKPKSLVMQSKSAHWGKSIGSRKVTQFSPLASPPRAPDIPVVSPKRSDAGDTTSLSLRPSQSASQVQATKLEVDPVTKSRFFRPVQVAAVQAKITQERKSESPHLEDNDPDAMDSVHRDNHCPKPFPTTRHDSPSPSANSSIASRMPIEHAGEPAYALMSTPDFSDNYKEMATFSEPWLANSEGTQASFEDNYRAQRLHDEISDPLRWEGSSVDPVEDQYDVSAVDLRAHGYLERSSAVGSFDQDYMRTYDDALPARSMELVDVLDGQYEVPLYSITALEELDSGDVLGDLLYDDRGSGSGVFLDDLGADSLMDEAPLEDSAMGPLSDGPGRGADSIDLEPLDDSVQTDSSGFSREDEVAQADFVHGRELLLGMREDMMEIDSSVSGRPVYQTVSKAEESVAKQLKGHWLPQRF
ncbi:hypothetical protein EIP91_011063 [Steccherinum ochraceum]|uniref:Uncharacterized protein n=1 Tax=Steccherinum ochraceum TaxID=92696 RepID=A0A4R0RVM2_9APHY|nr:hypothetical protein EIP91_011063 [Steccherinum ochraceum]